MFQVALRHHALPLLIYAVGYGLLVYPVLPFFPTHILQDGGDGLQNLWNNWWVRHAVAHGQSPWSTDHLYFPHGISLIGATLNPFNGFCTVALCGVVSQVVAFNLMVVFSFVATGYFTYLLVRELTGAVWPSVFAGAVFTFCTYHTAHATSHMQLVSMEWLPLFLLVWIRLLRKPGLGGAMLSALALFLVLLCDYYYTLYAVALGALLLVARGVQLRRPLFFAARPLRLPLLAFVVSCLALCGPIIVELLRFIGEGPLAGAHDSLVYRNDLLSLFVPGSGWYFHEWTDWYSRLHPIGGQYIELGSYLGWTVIALALYGLWVGQRTGTLHDTVPWLLCGALFYVLSLGNELLVLGQTFPGIPTPHGILESIFPGLAVGGMPVRMVVVTHLAAAILAGFGMRHAWQRLPSARLLLVPFLALYAFEIWPRTQRIARPEVTSVIETLRDLPTGAVAGWPSMDPASLYYQTLHRQPITAGYVARRPQALEDYRLLQDRLRERGQYLELMRVTQATYLVLDRIDAAAATSPELKLISRDHRFDLYTWTTSPLPAFDVDSFVEPEDAVRVAAADRTWITLEVTSRGDRGCSFVCGGSLARTKVGSLLYGHRLEVADDALFKVSMQRGNEVFQGNWGRLDAAGKARFRCRRALLEGVVHPEAYFTLIVFEGDLIGQVRRIHRPVRLDLGATPK